MMSLTSCQAKPEYALQPHELQAFASNCWKVLNIEEELPLGSRIHTASEVRVPGPLG